MDNEDRYRRAADYVDANREGSDTKPPSYPPIPPLAELRINPAELDTALTPQCVVASYLFADVALMAAPGGSGKTTLFLYEAAHIALGRPLYGLQVHTPGVVVLVTAEDSRALLIARLGRIMEALDLGAEERAKVCERVMIWDVTGAVCRLTELDRQSNVVLTGLADAIVERFRDATPVMVAVDPSVSFGAGERLINDNEQSLILAARRIVKGLGCCVRLICHTGKQGARDGVIDQYAARGGSALTDGARMVAVLRPWEDAEKDKLSPPPGLSVGSDEQVVVLARAKLSYSAPQPIIWLARRGYAFQHFFAPRPDPETEARERADQVERYLIDQLASGSYHTKTTLDDAGIMPRAKLRAALSSLIAAGRVIYAELPQELRHGGRKDYLYPAKATPPGSASAAGGVGQKSTPTPPVSETPSTPPPPYREKNGGGVDAAVFPLPSCHPAGEGWRGGGGVGGVGTAKAPGAHVGGDGPDQTAATGETEERETGRL